MLPCVRRTPLLGLFALFAILDVASARAQALPTATRKVSLAVFGGATYLHPDFGAGNDFGYVFGGDVTVHFRLVDTSLEVRYTSANGTYDDQHSFLAGIKVERAFHRFRPYVDFLAGTGKINYDHPELVSPDPNYTHDNSTVYDAGVGVDYALSPRFALKLDAQGQSWRIGQERPAFHPTNVSVGIVYQIPYHRLRGR